MAKEDYGLIINFLVLRANFKSIGAPTRSKFVCQTFQVHRVIKINTVKYFWYRLPNHVFSKIFWCTIYTIKYVWWPRALGMFDKLKKVWLCGSTLSLVFWIQNRAYIFAIMIGDNWTQPLPFKWTKSSAMVPFHLNFFGLPHLPKGMRPMQRFLGENKIGMDASWKNCKKLNLGGCHPFNDLRTPCRKSVWPRS